MRKDIRLYIDSKLADIGDQSFILWNFAVSDATNPTIIKNSYTQQVTLPATPINSSIFGHIEQGDRVTTTSGFNALKKTPFAIYDGMSNKLQEGYLRMDSVTPTAYKVTLYGGLGEYFYHLSYKSDGTKKTLADLTYQVTQDGLDVNVNPSTEVIPLTAAQVNYAWYDLSHNNDQHCGSLLNFAPCYNGIPSSGNFHADKAIYREGSVASTKIPNLYVSSGDYATKSNCGAILLELENKHTEWEMQDLRAYLQRPVLRVRKVIEACALAANSGGYSVTIGEGGTDAYFFNTDNPYWDKAWMTLPLLDRSKITPSSVKLADLLAGTCTPAEFLLGYAKMCGLMFLCEGKNITIMTRSDFYLAGNHTTIDLSSRLNKDYELQPTTHPSRFLDFKYPTMYGEKVAGYEEKYGKVYGEQKIDTNYSFDNEETDILDSLPFSGAADVLESSIDFVDYGGATNSEGAYISSLLKFAFSESVNWKLYKTESGEETELECEPSAGWLAPLRYSLGNAYTDFFAKAQLHGEEGKEEDGSGVLLFYTGFVNRPADSYGIHSVDFHLSDDPAEISTLLGSEPCWDVSVTGSNLLSVSSFPSFRRQINGTEVDNDAQWDFGTPKEYYTNDTPKTTLYSHFWNKYLSDYYLVDSVHTTRKVDFRGMQVNVELLRNFYWFENSIWILYKITNYSQTTDDLVECEFVRVGSAANYYEGQTNFIY